jgi:CheY-like chemotaxis protein
VSSNPSTVEERGGSVVAVINTSDDLVRVLKDSLVQRGFNVATAHIRDIKSGEQDFVAFLTSHDPVVIVYDIAVPYEDNWTFFQMLRQLPVAQDRTFIVTTVNKRVLEQRVGVTEAIEIQGGRADDLDPVLEAIQKVVGSKRSIAQSRR